MLNLKAYINTAYDETYEYIANTCVTEEDGAIAVSLHALFYDEFDPEFGCGIDFEIDDMESFMADYRCNEYWCKPFFGTDCSQIPDDTQGLIVKKNDGSFLVILPLVSKQYKCVLFGKNEKTVTAKLCSWYKNMHECDAAAFVYAEGENPYRLLEKCTNLALKMLNNGCRKREERRYPPIFEYLGWCSWDAFGIKVSEESIVKKCDEFRKKNIPVKWMIIDDMWGEVHDFYGVEYKNFSEMFTLMHSSKLYSFKADPKRFPGGLDGCIKKVKDYGIKVGMWHPITGYWMGIDPKGDIYKELKDTLIEAEDGRIVHSFKQEKAYRFYSAFHDYLAACGAEFVKIDNQSCIRRFYKNFAPVGEIASSIHKAMEASVGQHFDNAMINCMGMANEDMWNRSFSPISRCSDDFKPENREWFATHIMQCSYNDLIQGQLYYCDWDMWWTDDGQALKNSVLRAVSGGPVYVSDTLDRSRSEILAPLMLSDGKILRCDRPAMPCIDCLTTDPTKTEKIFKLQNMAGESGIVAVFNINENNKMVCGTVAPSDVDGVSGEKFVIYEHFSRTAQVVSYNETIEVSLSDNDDIKLYIIVPLKDGFAPIGRIDKFISPKSIKNVSGREIALEEDGAYAFFADGELVIK